MNTLYYAKMQLDVVFVSHPMNTSAELLKEAEKFLKEEARNINSSLRAIPSLVIKEIESLKDIPKDWHDALAWGQNPDSDELSVSDLFLKSNKEYQEYIRLKKKFEG